MLEILVIIAVVRQFMRLAFDKGYSRGLWGFIGAISYYGPILLVSLVIYPSMVLAGVIEYNEGDKFKLILVNLIVGIGCCAIAYQILKRLPSKLDEGNPDILDASTHVHTDSTSYQESGGPDA